MIYEVLTSDAIAGQLDFVAASAPPNEIIMNGVGAGVVFENSFGLEWFEPGDNLMLNSFFCRIPFGFGYGALRVQGNFEFRDAGGATIVIPEFAQLETWLYLIHAVAWPSLAMVFSFGCRLVLGVFGCGARFGNAGFHWSMCLPLWWVRLFKPYCIGI